MNLDQTISHGVNRLRLELEHATGGRTRARRCLHKAGYVPLGECSTLLRPAHSNTFSLVNNCLIKAHQRCPCRHGL